MAKKEMTEKQKAFCLEYLKDFNAARAARDAGYADKASKEQGSHLLTNINVQIFLRDAINKATAGAEASIRRVVQELELIAFSDLSDVMNLDGSKEDYDPETGLPRNRRIPQLKTKAQMGEKSRLIQEISTTETMFNATSKVKLYSKMEALKMLGQYHQMFVDRMEVTNPDGKLQPIVNIYLPDNKREKK